MRILALLLLFAFCGCQEEAPRRRPWEQPLIQREPLPYKSDGTFSGCSGPPVTPQLAILSDHVILDGTFVDDDAQLESTLNAKQELNAVLGGDAIRDIVIQVGTQVSEDRVARLLGRARHAGFINVTRLSPFEEPSRPKPRTPLRSKPFKPLQHPAAARGAEREAPSRSQ